MFDFKLMNKALTDRNVRGTEFKTLYLIANNCSMNNTKSLDMYNALLMEKLHYSESTIKRCIKVLEEMGYISVNRATKKSTPNIITLNDVRNECTNAVTNAVRTDTLYNNKYNIHSIRCLQSNNEDNEIPYNVYTGQQLEREKEEREKKASYNNSLNEDNSIVGDKSNEEIHSIDPVFDNLNEDTEIDYEVYEEQQMAKEEASYNSNDFNADNEELQGIRGIQSIGTETDNSNEDDYIDAMFEAYERGLIEAAEHSSIPQQGNNPNGIDWDAWRERFEQCKLGMLNAKSKTELDLWKANCKESLKFAKKHMGPEKYKKQRAIFDNWYTASEPHFHYRESKNTMETNKHKYHYSQTEWESKVQQIAESPIKEPLVKDAVEYLIGCGIDPTPFIELTEKELGVVV